MNAQELARASLNIAKNYNTVYALGTFGQPLTSSLIAQKAAQLPSWYTSSRKASLNNHIGAYAFDCVGLIKGILWGWPSVRYASGNTPDIDANTMLNRCTYISYNFNEAIPAGAVVWTNDHIGVYVGDGLAVECTPAFAGGVQITAVANKDAKTGYYGRYWRAWGKLPYVSYAAAAASAPIKVGDAVKLKAGATLYNSSNRFASFVYNSTLYVREISGNRAVISTLKSGAVTGATNITNLTKL